MLIGWLLSLYPYVQQLGMSRGIRSLLINVIIDAALFFISVAVPQLSILLLGVWLVQLILSLILLANEETRAVGEGMLLAFFLVLMVGIFLVVSRWTR
jgi:hypothetical protein